MNQPSLFSHKKPPLIDLARPRFIKDFIGIEKIFQSYPILEHGDILGCIFSGPPGVGKTTLAQLYAEYKKWHFASISAVTSGIKEIRDCLDDFKHFNQKCVLFIDEIHRLNKSAQDLLLPGVEKGDYVLFAATTENPRSIITKALLSRLLIISIPKHGLLELKQIYQRLYCQFNIPPIDSRIEDTLINYSQGDGRRSIINLELFFDMKKAFAQDSDDQILERLLPSLKEQGHVHDRKGRQHYDLISAFIKSMRASDQKAAMLYLCWMLKGGEDPLFIARRMIIFASEDIGMADSNALTLALNVQQAVEKIGLPECGINLAHGVSYLSKAPKDTSSYKLYLWSQEYLSSKNDWSVPAHLQSTNN